MTNAPQRVFVERSESVDEVLFTFVRVSHATVRINVGENYDLGRMGWHLQHALLDCEPNPFPQVCFGASSHAH